MADDLTLLRQQKDTGTTIKPGPAVIAGPGQVVTDADLADIGAEVGLNGPMVADLLSSMAAHENLGTNLFRAFARQTDNPMLATTFKGFEADARTAVATYHRLFEQLGVPWGYISPAARMTEAMDTKLQEAFLLQGSADPVVVDLKMVEAVLLASTMCVANTAVLANLAAGLDEGEVRSAIEAAVTALEAPQQAHLQWAADTQQAMAVGQARSAALQKGVAAVDAVVGKVKDVAQAVKDALPSTG